VAVTHSHLDLERSHLNTLQAALDVSLLPTRVSLTLVEEGIDVILVNSLPDFHHTECFSEEHDRNTFEHPVQTVVPRH